MVRKRRPTTTGVAVIGLGRFGKSLALELMDQDVEVLGIDDDPRIVESLAGRLTQVVRADSTNEDALRQLSVHEFDRVVIGVGTNLEASILTASVNLGFGIPTIWAKAVSNSHAKILTQLGVHHVVRPEHDMGKRVAHLVRGRMIDYIEFDEGFAMVKTKPPSSIIDTALGNTDIRSRYGVTIVAIKRPAEGFTYATAETIIHRADIIIASGTIEHVEQFSEIP